MGYAGAAPILRLAISILASPRWLAICFLVCALPTGLGYALLSPLGAPPDELAHIARAEGLRLGQITNPQSPNKVPGEMINAGIFMLFIAMQREPYAEQGNVPPLVLAQTRAIGWGSQNLFCNTQMTLYFPIFYIPASLGLEAGKLAGLRPLFAIYLARVFTLCGYLGLGAAALYFARFGSALLFALLTLPSSICLGACCSQDGLMIAACALAAALRTRAGSQIGLSWWGALALLAAVALAKPAYALLLLFCLAPVRAAGLRRRAGLVALAVVLPASWLMHINNMGFFPWSNAPYHPGPLWPGDKTVWLHNTLPAYNIQVLRAHPVECLLLPFHSLVAQWGGMWRQTLAAVARDKVLVWPWEYPCLAAALGFAAFTAPEAGARCWAAVDSLLSVLIMLLSFMAVELSLYLTTTQAGATIIDGVQGRYFLPLLPFGIFPLSWFLSRLRVSRFQAGVFCLPAMLLAFFNAMALPDFLFQFYRMAGP